MKLFEYNGVHYTAAELSELSGIKTAIIRQRINSGWTVKKAVTTPTKKTPPRTAKREEKYRVVFTRPVPEVFKEMQPRLNKVYIAVQHEGHSSKKTNRSFYTITLENGKNLIVYPDEFINLGAAADIIA